MEVFYLGGWLALVVFFCALGMPAMVPGGPNGFVCVGVLVLPLGAYLEAARSRWLPGFLLYGCLGALALVLSAYSAGGGRAPSMGSGPNDLKLLLVSALFVLAGGVGCRGIAVFRHARIGPDVQVDPERCRVCGYLLYGLPEPRCPECGTPFRITAARIAFHGPTRGSPFPRKPGVNTLLGMPSQPEPIDPTDVERINQRVRAWASPEETVHPVRTGQVLIEQDALDGLTDQVRTRARGGRVLLVVDRTPIRRGGEDLKALIEVRLARAGPLEIRRLPVDAGASFHADLETAKQLATELSDCAALVSVGSGSITDVAKYARHLHVEQTGRDLPFVCFPTAASVTAYTSALAVLSIDGVKRTLPARAPDAVVCDLQTLADAPPSMTQAGFGDVLARSVSYGDWFLAHQLGMDEGFSQVPARLLETAERRMIDSAERVAACELDGIRVLTDAVLLAGMAMSLVSQTAPVSGWEHVISHCLDLTAAGDGRQPALHGAQVGVATLVSARAYERAWGDLDLDRLLSNAPAAHADHTIESAFGKCDPNGKLTAEVRRDYARKLTRWSAALPARRIFVQRARAGEFDEFLQENVRSSVQVADALRRARAPQRFAELGKPISESAALHAIQNAHLIRARFTLGDLLAQTGWLTESTGTALLDDLEAPRARN